MTYQIGETANIWDPPDYLKYFRIVVVSIAFRGQLDRSRLCNQTVRVLKEIARLDIFFTSTNFSSIKMAPNTDCPYPEVVSVILYLSHKNLFYRSGYPSFTRILITPVTSYKFLQDVNQTWLNELERQLDMTFLSILMPNCFSSSFLQSFIGNRAEGCGHLVQFFCANWIIVASSSTLAF